MPAAAPPPALLGAPLVLASASPRRAALLRGAGLDPIIAPAPCDETPHPGEKAEAYAARIAADKLAAACAHAPPEAWVLTADTVVWLPSSGDPLGKPIDADACRRVLPTLWGPQGHRVTTAWALRPGPGAAEVHSETTAVWMRPLGSKELERYLATDAWRDKAGGYGIQAEAASWVTRIEGSYTNVVGLPVAQVVARLEGAT